MDRAHRHDLKHDKFVEQVGHTVEYAAEHKQEFTKWGAIALGVIVLAAAFYGYTRWQASERQEALHNAIRIQDAQVGPPANDFFTFFPTAAEKSKAVVNAWTGLANKYPGTAEGSIAHFYLATTAADSGNTQEAEKHFKQVIDSGKEPYISQAKMSLSSIYNASGRNAESETLLRSVVNSPTVLVSKEQATIALARTIMKTKPAEARKLLEPLRTERGPVSRAALTLLGEIPNR